MSFKIADTDDGMVPRTIELDLASGGAFLEGAPLIVDGSGDFAECGADPALIAAFAVGNAGADTSGFNILGRKEFPPLKIQATLCPSTKRFPAKYTGTLPANDGGSYGLTRGSDSIWRVDFGKTGGSARLLLVGRLTDTPEEVPEVIVTVLAANVQPY